MAFTVYFCLIAYSFLLCCSISSCLASYYDVCNEVPKCGVFDFGYPFGLKYSGCGDPDFQLQCDYGSGNALINIGGDDYRILGHSFTNNSMKIMNNNLWGDKCNFPGNYSQFWLSASHFHIADTYTNLTIWGLCNKSTEAMSQLRLLQLCGDDWYYNIRRPEQGMRFCKTHFQLPIHKDYLHFNMKQSFPWQGFEVSWRVDPNRCESCGACLNSIGNCGYDIRKPTSFLCYCPDGSTHPDRCPDNGTQGTGGGNMLATVLSCFLFVVGVVVTAIGLAAAVFLVYDACKRRNPPPQTLQVNGYDGAKSPYSSSNPESPLFIAAEKSSSIELGF